MQADAFAVAMQSISDASAGFPHQRRCFYVHGKPAVEGTDAAAATTGCTLYVEHLIPHTTSTPIAGSKSKPPVIFIPGAAHTSACWVTTPDGRPGWSSHFLSRGHDVYLVDPPFTGRSPWAPRFSQHSASSPDVLTTIPAQVIAGRWTALAQQQQPGPWPQARLHTQWPGTGQAGDAAFEALAASLVGLPHDVPEAATQRAMRAAGAALVDRIVEATGGGGDADIGEEAEEEAEVVLVAHSLGAPRALLIADARPSRVSGLVLLEPNGPPWSEQALGGLLLKRPWGLTEAEITWSPPRPRALSSSAIAGGHDEAGVVAVGDDRGDDDVRGGDHTLQEAHFNLRTEKSTDPARSDCTLQVEDESSGIAPRMLSNLVDVPVAVITGEASHHAMYDWCTVRFLRQAGVKRVDHIELWKKGIRGNGHLFISEKNSNEIAEVTRVWIDALAAR